MQQPNPNDPWKSAIILSDIAHTAMVNRCLHEFKIISQMVTDDKGREFEMEEEVCSECNVTKSSLMLQA